MDGQQSTIKPEGYAKYKAQGLQTNPARRISTSSIATTRLAERKPDGYLKRLSEADCEARQANILADSVVH